MEPERLDRGDGVRLAVRRGAGRSPAVVFLPGYGSDMTGDKATALAAFCSARGQAVVRFDYSGHGESDGAFADGTITRWRDDALAVIDRATEGPVVLVGSSMGGWIGLLAALRCPGRVAGFVGVAAAPDFTERLMWDAMTPPEREALAADGELPGRSGYMPPRPVTMGLIQDGRRHLLLDRPVPLTCPVRLLHGQADDAVPWEFSLRLAAAVVGTNVTVTLVKDGDHRLARPSDIALLTAAVASLLGQDGG